MIEPARIYQPASNGVAPRGKLTWENADMNLNRTSCRPLSFAKSLIVSPGRKVRTVPIGLFAGMRLNLDLSTETQIYLGLWERETYAILRHQARSASWFVDVGAGKGELCIYFAMQPSMKRVIGFEPNATEVAIFEQNVELNRRHLKSNPEVRRQFVGTRSGAQLITLDALGLGAGGFGLTKLDVDGFELDVLKGGEDLFSRHQTAVLVETHSEELERGCKSFLEAHGYLCHIVKNAWWRIIVPEQRVAEQNRWLWAEPA